MEDPTINTPEPVEAPRTAAVEAAPVAPRPAVDVPVEANAGDGDGDEGSDGDAADRPAAKRRRGSRGGRRRKKPGEPWSDDDGDEDGDDENDDSRDDETSDEAVAEAAARPAAAKRAPRPKKAASRPAVSAEMATPGTDQADLTDAGKPVRPPRPARPARTRKPAAAATEPVEGADVELPEPMSEGRVRDETSAAAATVPRRPRIGDTRPAPAPEAPAVVEVPVVEADAKKKRRRTSGKKAAKPVTESRSRTAVPIELDEETLEKRRGRARNGKPVGRYLMCVQARTGLTQVAVLEGRSLIEHYVSRPADDAAQIHGNIYIGRVQNVLPGMEAAFVDIATPKNAVLYRGDIQYDAEDIVEKADKLRIEQLLKAKQLILCQVTKNPIAAKGARLTQEVSLPGRFVVFIPNSKTYGISKRLPEDERKRLRNILDRVKPAEHGLIVRTAAENATEQELQADVIRLSETWNDIYARAEKARKANQCRLLYREPDLAVRVIREEFNADYRGVVIDDRQLYEDVKSYIEVMNPELADRVEYYDSAAEGLPLFEQHHVHEQLHKALDRKVWLPSGGSLIIEHTEALTVIDVNTGKNVGKTNLEETVFHNNMEAAEEIARQLRLRDIGGIIVIDFIDMEIKDNRRKVVDAFRSALARDKTRTQVFEISELGLVEMTRKRIGEGLLTSFASHCPNCEGRGVIIDHSLLD